MIMTMIEMDGSIVLRNEEGSRNAARQFVTSLVTDSRWRWSNRFPTWTNTLHYVTKATVTVVSSPYYHIYANFMALSFCDKDGD